MAVAQIGAEQIGVEFQCPGKGLFRLVRIAGLGKDPPPADCAPRPCSTNGSEASAFGIYVYGDVAGALTNTSTGTITANATNDNGNASAFGIYVDGSLAGTLTNDGAVNAHASGAYADATGIYVYGGVSNTLTNNGPITVTATASNSASAYGIYVDGAEGIAGTLTNSGAINATATGADAFAAGIYVDGPLADTLTTSGPITVSASGDNQVAAFGIASAIMASAPTPTFVDSGAGASTGAITNSGTITVSASGVDQAYAYGIVTGDLAAGASITNTSTGIISATVTATNAASAFAYGIATTDLAAGASITNNGTITASAPVNGNGYSIHVDSGAGSVVNSGLLQGNIYLGGTVNMSNSGTLYIPNGVQGHVGGNYDQTEAGVLKIDAVSNSDYGQLLEIVGTGTFAAGTGINVNVKEANTLAINQSLNDVIGTGTLSASTFTVTDNSRLFDFTAIIDGNTVDLDVKRGLLVRQSVVNTGNETGLGAAQVFDDLIAGGAIGNADMDAVITALGQLETDQEIANAVQQTLPLLTGDMKQASLDALRSSAHVVQDRLSAKRGLSSGDICKIERRVWLKPFGSWANQSDRKGVSGFDGDTYGLILGADTEMAAPSRLGLAVAYSHSDVDGKSAVARHDAEINSYQAMVYGSQRINDRTDIDFQANIGTNKNDGERHIDFLSPNRIATADYDSTSAHVGVGLGRTCTIDAKNTFIPSVRADYSWIKDESYTETGADALNLNVDGDTTDELILGIDGQFNHALNNSILLTAKLGMGYDTLAEESSITASFVGGGAAFTTNGLDPAPWLVRGGLGLVMFQANGLEFTASYDFEARSDFSNHTAGLKVLKSF
ncbi:MAG: hypothetical protein AUK28_09375 [Desulfobacterales bacterium CG2_30_60_27]|nr:MAG: hypothetical protein AUK28_09375 [Desulfobacterales bacterium CG2_30_60_27]